MWASYQAVRGSDGTITATRITFEPNRVDANEKSFRDGAEPVFVAADPAKHKPAQLKFGSQMPVTWELLLDQNLQDYVTRIGEALVPQYQKDLPDSDPAKIHFRFYVVKIASTWMGNMEDTVDLPNGIVLIQDNVLEELVDEAQLAAYISNSIAHVLEKQDYLHHGRLHGDKYGRLAGVAGTMTSTYLAPLSLAFDRIAINCWRR